MAQAAKVTPKKPKRSKKVLLILNIVALVGLSMSTAFYAYKYYDLKSEISLTQEQKNDRLVQEVAKVYTLPSDEKPVVAVVSDEEKFKQEYSVFPAAKKDDYLLLYEKAGLAILYRPSDKKVVATAPLSIRSELGIGLIGPEAESTAVEKTIDEKVGDQTKVIAKKTSANQYSTTVVVDVKGGQDATAKQLADLVGGVVGKLPEGESAPDGSDFVIIVATKPAAE